VAAQLPDGGDAVLKINLRDAETKHEGDAFERWQGRGAVRLLAHDRERWALLIERCRPGTQLWALAEDEATTIAADVLEQLWVPAAEPFRRLEDEAARGPTRFRDGVWRPSSSIAPSRFCGRRGRHSASPSCSTRISTAGTSSALIEAGSRSTPSPSWASASSTSRRSSAIAARRRRGSWSGV
jgi:hypothetical protein